MNYSTGTLSGTLATMQILKTGQQKSDLIFPQILVISQGQKTQCSTFLIPISFKKQPKWTLTIVPDVEI